MRFSRVVFEYHTLASDESMSCSTAKRLEGEM